MLLILVSNQEHQESGINFMQTGSEYHRLGSLLKVKALAVASVVQAVIR